ncbi:ribonuclease E/G [Mediterraneibacter massiliensis]|uniref:ribonuclease E/G n=1 Tax=Mediterraneibacter massiliensis TaxID=1720300 RepID=UPI0022E5FB0B|nr:ribonuclease E/G [Mediterraneibacter massiliensis]
MYKKRKVLLIIEGKYVWTYFVEDGEIAEIHCSALIEEKQQTEPALGNIYIGKVKTIVENIGAAFVEIQKGVNCYYDISQAEHAIFAHKQGKKAINIDDELIVQINKEAVKTKAATVTSNLSLTGRYAVLTHGNTRIGVSGKLPKDIKETYKTQLSALKNDRFGLIIRTNAVTVPFETVAAEIERLREEYKKILDTAQTRTCYSCLRSAPPAYITDLKNVYTEGLEEIIIDNKELYTDIQKYFLQEQPELLALLKLYDDKQLSLANLYSTQSVLEKVSKERVWLKNGGYLVIQPTEALTVIDVNTGKYTAKKKRKDAGFQVNMEAAKEAARQIRLRNLSGIIIIDFINMETEDEKKTLVKELRCYLEKDPIQTTFVDVTPLQLVEITRKKVRKPLHELLSSIDCIQLYNN